MVVPGIAGISKKVVIGKNNIRKLTDLLTNGLLLSVSSVYAGPFIINFFF
jgi:hypothetical protein